MTVISTAALGWLALVTAFLAGYLYGRREVKNADVERAVTELIDSARGS